MKSEVVRAQSDQMKNSKVDQFFPKVVQKLTTVV